MKFLTIIVVHCNYDTLFAIIYFVLGLGKASQGISTALSVEKTSKRGGKIVNIAAEQGIYTCITVYSTHIEHQPHTHSCNYETQ